MLELTRPEVAAKYQLTIDEDFFISICCYSGKISNISMCGAEGLIKSKSPYLVAKPAEEENIEQED